MNAGGVNGRAWWRWAGAFLLLLLAIHAARSAIVAVSAKERPELALAVWPGQPDALLTAGLASIGGSARLGQPPSPEALERIDRAARAAPLAEEPLLVEAASRLSVGDVASAERLLLAAVRRNPRAPAARFLLADLYIRENRIAEAMRELAALDRRLGRVSADFAPAMASFLQQPGALPQVGPVLEQNPALREAVLAQLVTNKGTGPMLLALARPGDQRQPWFTTAFERFLAEGDVGGARTLYARAVGPLPQAQLGDWAPGPPPDPLSWRFPAGKGGAAEPSPGGPLRLVYYGREEAVLAERLLLLAPGRYRLGQRLEGRVPAGAFEWRLTCLEGNRTLATLSVRGGRGQGDWLVPAGCPAQKLQLVGRPGDVPVTVNVTLSDLALSPVGGASR